MLHRLFYLFIISMVCTLSLAQEKSQTFSIGIERGFEVKSDHTTFLTDNGIERLIPGTTHKYWRLSIGIPFRISNVKFDAGLGFSHNQFTQNFIIINNSGNFNPSGKYSGIGFDYFLRIPLGIGEDRFEMGPEFRHQIMAAKYSSQNSLFPSSADREGKVRSGYFNVGVFANYIVFRKEQLEIGLSTSLGFSTFKYHRHFFISSKNLFPYMHFGVVFNTYRQTKK